MLCICLSAAPCVAQISPTFNILSSTSDPAPNHLIAIDLNNDGISDLVSTSASSSAEFYVSIAKGDGTFNAPVGYPMGGAPSIPLQFASGDFNSDGNVDVVFSFPGTTQLGLALGNGDGTFQPVKYLSFQLSGNETFSSGLPILAADLNRDGKQDLVIAAVSPTYAPGDPYDEGPQDLYLLEGDGTGSFPTATSIYSVPQDVVFDTYAFGDFNGDDNADLVFTTTPFPNPFVPGGTWNLHVLFGGGTGEFEDHLLATTDSWRTIPALGTGDINGDGRTDFFLLGTVYLGQPDKTFIVQNSDVPDMNQSAFAMADFNDDGRMDLVSYGSTANAYNACCAYLIFQLGSNTPGTFTSQVVQLPVSLNGASPAVVGNFNNDSKPDVAVGQYEPAATYVNPQITTAINSTSNGLSSNCPYPMGASKIAVCSPNQYTPGVVSFDASASSFGTLRKMELWVDGDKIAEQYKVWENQAWLKFNATLPGGTHHATIYTGDVDHTLNRTDFAFTVGDDKCAAPADPGVNICEPWDGGFANSPTIVRASANLPGTLARLEIWVDGAKKFTENTSTWLDVTLEIKSGKHAFTVIAVNSDGSQWEKTTTATLP